MSFLICLRHFTIPWTTGISRAWERVRNGDLRLHLCRREHSSQPTSMTLGAPGSQDGGVRSKAQGEGLGCLVNYLNLLFHYK